MQNDENQKRAKWYVRSNRIGAANDHEWGKLQNYCEMLIQSRIDEIGIIVEIDSLSKSAIFSELPCTKSFYEEVVRSITDRIKLESRHTRKNGESDKSNI